MSDEEQFWRASIMHAHQWILVHSEPLTEPLREPVFARILVCPVCGNAWGKRTFLTSLHIHFNAVERPCPSHGGGGLTRGRDYDGHHKHSDEFAAFLIEQFFLDRSVLDFHD